MLERERWGLRDRYVHVEVERGDTELREWGEGLNINSCNYKHGQYRNFAADVWIEITMNTIICFDWDLLYGEIF